MSHFFSKVYGSTEAVSPFTNKLSENAAYFQNRIDMFFQHYESDVLFKKYDLTFDHIYLKVIRVNQMREPISHPKVIGYYDWLNKSYISVYKNKSNLSQRINISFNETF